MYFTITTNYDTAKKIEKQCEFDAKNGDRSYIFGGAVHDVGFSIVCIKAKDGLKIEPSDIFFLGLFCNNQ